MFRKLHESFSATHLTIMFGLAILAPSALYAIPSFTNVAIEDPNSGSRAFVNNGRQLYVYDPIAGYANSPANKIDIFAQATHTTCTNVYTIPAGKAFVLTSALLYLVSSTSSTPEIDIYSGPGIGSCANVLAAGVTSFKTDTVAANFGTGIVVPSGSSLSVQGLNSVGSLNLIGYLVPASAVPAPASPEATANYIGPSGVRSVAARR